MRHFISRCFERVRKVFAPAAETPDLPISEPALPEPPRTNQAQSNSTCGVYIWATAHGIDIKPSSPLASCDCYAHQPPPETGTFVIDTRTDRVGQVMGSEGPYIQLRPPHGGKEWEARPDAVRAVTRSELLSAKVRQVNAAERWGK
ncbi:hypothetical protein ACWCZ5_13460 [Streptomyces sp. NPDC001667]